MNPIITPHFCLAKNPSRSPRMHMYRWGKPTRKVLKGSNVKIQAQATTRGKGPKK